VTRDVPGQTVLRADTARSSSSTPGRRPSGARIVAQVQVPFVARLVVDRILRRRVIVTFVGGVQVRVRLRSHSRSVCVRFASGQLGHGQQHRGVLQSVQTVPGVSQCVSSSDLAPAVGADFGPFWIDGSVRRWLRAMTFWVRGHRRCHESSTTAEDATIWRLARVWVLGSSWTYVVEGDRCDIVERRSLISWRSTRGASKSIELPIVSSNPWRLIYSRLGGLYAAAHQMLAM